MSSSIPPLDNSAKTPAGADEAFFRFNFTKPIPRSNTFSDNNTILEENKGVGNSFSLPTKINEYIAIRNNQFNFLVNNSPLPACSRIKNDLIIKIENEKDLYPNDDDREKITELYNYLKSGRDDLQFLNSFTDTILQQSNNNGGKTRYQFESNDSKLFKIGEDFAKVENHGIYSMYGQYYNCMQHGFMKIVTMQTVYNCRNELAEFRSIPLHWIQSEWKRKRYWKKYEDCIREWSLKTKRVNGGSAGERNSDS